MRIAIGNKSVRKLRLLNKHPFIPCMVLGIVKLTGCLLKETFHPMTRVGRHYNTLINAVLHQKKMPV